ncbi:LysR family transcriptional regulator [Lentzea pudingi]|uniref:LysR family transcriptional regulator n=1 Tax=Lentzea pudingi TaxID=1789439 RepID=A0ABQ2IRD9_9PSEU|nr:LysR family transcriptional regulator [Lentzea pudingi]GGN23431.1 LysR family transcriptional regulator [Lentzea pudingi]
MDVLEVRELRYFVAVAEELNFSRAAERLGIAQPPLSRAIRQIENRLGVQLMVRGGRSLTLTDAGRTLLTEARAALDAVNAATHRTRRAAGAAQRLKVTAKPGVASGLLDRIVDAYRAPGVPEVDIVVSGYRGQAELVRTGAVDMALTSSPYNDSGLESEQLATERRVAALPVGHSLTDRTSLYCADLADLPFPRWPNETSAERAYWSGQDVAGVGVRSAGSAGPAIGDTAQLLEVVGLGQAVALIPRTVAQRNPRTDIVYLPVEDASPYLMSIVWPAGSRSPAIREFVRVAIELTAPKSVDRAATNT